MSLMALQVLLPKQRAAMPMGGSGSKAGAVGICGVAGYTASTAMPWVVAAAGVAPKRVLRNYIVSRHEAHPQTVEQSGEQGVSPLVLGHLRLE